MISLLGSISSAESVYQPETVISVLEHPKELLHQAEFTGRPATSLFASDEHVVKLRTDFIFQPKDVVKRATIALEAERELGVYHPDKTWFIQETDDKVVIGNITPKLTPFHTALPAMLGRDDDLVMDKFRQLLKLYGQTVQKNDRRLDEGLSNFGWDKNGTVYYLDDDSYGWDDFTSFANVLPVWIRQLDAITIEFSCDLANLLVEVLVEVFGTSHPVKIFYGQLRNNLAVSERERNCINAILQVLYDFIFSDHRLKKGADAARQTKSKGSNKLENPVLARLDEKRLTRISAPRFGVIADVHANLPALTAVLAELKKCDIEEFLVLGDVVGYGPHAAECIELLAEHNCLIIQGNHDYAAGTGDAERGFSALSKWVIEWTCDNLDDNYRSWLANLPPDHSQDGWLAVHGAPIDKRYFYAYVYHMTYQANLDWLQKQKLHVGFHGHSHVQATYRRNAKDEEKSNDPVQDLSAYQAALVCPGSVGQPRGGQTESEYAIYDSAKKRLEFYSVAYDVQKIISDMKQKHFPSSLYERLTVGH